MSRPASPAFAAQTQRHAPFFNLLSLNVWYGMLCDLLRIGSKVPVYIYVDCHFLTLHITGSNVHSLVCEASTGDLGELWSKMFFSIPVIISIQIPLRFLQNSYTSILSLHPACTWTSRSFNRWWSPCSIVAARGWGARLS